MAELEGFDRVVMVEGYGDTAGLDGYGEIAGSDGYGDTAGSEGYGVSVGCGISGQSFSGGVKISGPVGNGGTSSNLFTILPVPEGGCCAVFPAAVPSAIE